MGEEREKGRTGKSLEEWEGRDGGTADIGAGKKIHIKGAILGLARDLALEGIQGVHGDVPS